MKQKIQKLLSPSFLRFVIVGGIAFVVEYASFYGLYYKAGMLLIIANGLSFGLGLLTSFMLNRLWTFGHKGYHKNPTQQFTLYSLLAGINLVVTLLLVSGFEWVGIKPRFGKFIAMVITSLWNFVIYKYFIFKHSSAPIDEQQ